MQFITPCTACKQKGYMFQTPCTDCQGFGLVTKQSTVDLYIPLGKVGQRCFIEEGGHQENPDEKPGRLVIEFTVKPDSTFEFDPFYSQAVKTTLSVDPVFAMIGGQKQVRGPDGSEITCDVPPACKDGYVIEIPHQGIYLSEVERGPLHIRIHFDMPQSLSEEEKDILKSYLNRRSEAAISKE